MFDIYNNNNNYTIFGVNTRVYIENLMDTYYIYIYIYNSYYV